MEIYLDNAATTRVCDESADAIAHALTVEYGNPSSLHAKGREAEKILRESRDTVAHALDVDSKNVFFTSGGTESNNWALLGSAYKMRHRGRHIVSTAIEHDSVLRPLEFLKQSGFDVTFIKPDKSGVVSSETVKNALRRDTVLVSVMHVNNETGAVQPASEIIETVRGSCGALVHVDAVQSFLKIPFSAGAFGADMMTVSAHKIHGPKGVGALYIKNKSNISPMIWGGAQESGQRAGTESLHNIAGFAAAVKAAEKHIGEADVRYREFQNYIRCKVSDAVPGVSFLPMGVPNIMSIALPGYQGETVLNFLDHNGVCVSRSSACKRNARSYVLEAMGLPAKTIDGTIRVSFSRYTNESEIQEFVRLLILATESIFTKL